MIRTVFSAVLALSLAVPALAQDEVSPEAFATNNAYGALYHEFGHLFVDQFQLPILGNEEYVADAIATLMLLGEKTDLSHAVSYDMVDGYLRMDAAFGASDMAEVDFNDEHGLDQQRASQMTCLLVGGDPDNFVDLADQMAFEPERQDACIGEYEQAARGWQRLIKDYLRGSGPEGAKLTVVYEPAGDKYAAMADLIKREKVLENVADTVTRQFVLQKPAKLKAAICDEENAFYDPEASAVTLCYEYLQLYYDLIANPEKAGAEFAEPS